MVEAWLPISLGATMAWGVGQIAAKRGTTLLGPRRMVVVVSLGEAVVFLAFYVALGGGDLGGPRDALVALLAGFTGMLGYVMYYEAIARGTISRVGTIVAAYPALTAVLALLLLGESVLPLQAGGVLLLLASAVLLGRQERRTAPRASARGVLLVLLAFLLWGAWGVLVKLAVVRLGEGPPFAYFALTNAAVGLGLLLLLVRKRHEGQHAPRLWAWPGATMLFGSAGVLFLTLALAAGPALLVVPLTGAYPVVTVLLAGPLLRERLGWREGLAFALFVAGLFLVAGG